MLGLLLQEASSDHFMHPQARGLGLSLDMEKCMKTRSVLAQYTNALRAVPRSLLTIIRDTPLEEPQMRLRREESRAPGWALGPEHLMLLFIFCMQCVICCFLKSTQGLAKKERNKGRKEERKKERKKEKNRIE